METTEVLGGAQEKPTVPRVQADPKLLDRLFESTDGWDSFLSPEASSQVKALSAASANPQAELRRFANVAFLADAFNTTPDKIAEMPEQWQRSYAQQVWKEEDANYDDDTFYAAVGKYRQKKNAEFKASNAMAKALSEDVFSGKDFASAYAARRAEAGDALDPAQEDFYREYAQNAWDHVSQRASKYKETVDAVGAYFEKESGAWSGETVEDVKSAFAAKANKKKAVAALASLPAEDAEFVIAVASARFKKPERTTAQRMVVGAGRSVIGFANVLGRASKRLPVHRLRLDKPGTYEESKPSDETLRKLKVEEMLESALTEDADSLRSDSLVQNIFVGTATTIPRMAAYLHPAGITADTIVVHEELRADFIKNGMDEATADKAASVGAVPYAALNFLETKMLLGKVMPGLFKELRSVTGKALAERFAGAAGTTFLTEMGAETAQDFIPAMVQHVAAKLDLAPARDWKKERGLYVEALPETAGVMGVLSILGASGATFKDREYGLEYIRSQDRLAALGFEMPVIEQVLAAPTPERGLAIMKEHWDERQSSPAQREAVLALNEEVREAQDLFGIPAAAAPAGTPLPADVTFTINRPMVHPENPEDTIPGQIQVDFYETIDGVRENTRSATLEELRDEGFAVPAIPEDIEPKQYTVEEMTAEIVARGGAVEGIESSRIPFSPELAASRPAIRREGNEIVVFDKEGNEIGRTGSPEGAAMILRRSRGLAGTNIDLSTPAAAANARAQASASFSDAEPVLASVFNLGQPNPPTVSIAPTMKGKTSSPKVMDALAGVIEAAGSRGGKLRFGRMGKAGRKALGFYRVKQKIIRVKTANDISTAAHEVAHLLSDVLFGFGHHWNAKIVPKQVRTEMMKLGRNLYGNQQPTGGYAEEGFAEFYRLYTTDPEKAEALAPLTFANFETNILAKNPDLMKAVKKAQEVGTIFHRQGTVERAKQGIAEQPSMVEKLSEEASEAMRSAKRKWVDAAEPIRKFVELANEQRTTPIPQAEDPYFQTTWRRMTADSTVAYMADNGMIDLAGRRTGVKPLVDAFKLVKGKVDNFMIYLWAKRSQVVWDSGRNPGLSKFDADALVAEFASPEFEQAAQIVYDWNSGVLEYAAQASPEMRQVVEKIRAADPGFYIPLFREFSAYDDRYQPGLSGKALVKRLKGSGRRIKNPVESMLAQAKAIVMKAHNEIIFNQMIHIADTTPGMGDYVTEVPPDQVATRVPNWQVIQQLMEAVDANSPNSMAAQAGKQMVEDLADMIDGQALTFFTPAMTPKQNEAPVLPRWRDGKVVWYEMDPELYATLSHMDAFRLPGALDLFLGMPARILRMGATGLRPAFILTNSLRDLRTLQMNSASSANSAHLFGLWLSSMREEFTEAITFGRVRSDWSDLFDRLGVQMAQSLSQDSKPVQKMARRLKRGGGWSPFDAQSNLDLYRQLIQFPEKAARLAEMKAVAEDMGWDPSMPMTVEIAGKLAVAAKQVTTDFTAAGEYARVANAILPFFNAGIQGPRANVRALRKDPTRFMIRGMVGTAAALALWYRNKDEEWWKEMDMKERYGWTYIPFGKEILRLPRAFEVDGIFMALTEALADAWYQNEPEQVKEWFGQFAGNLLQTDVVDGVPVPPLPVLGTLAAEQLANRSFFFDQAIVPRGEQYGKPEEQYNAFTSTAAIEAGKILGISPRRIDHAIRTLFGPVGSDLAAVFGRGDGTETVELESELADIPVAGVLFQRGGQMARSPESIEKLYDAYEEAVKVQQSKLDEETNEQRNRRLMIQDAVKTQTALNEISKHLASREKRRQIQLLRITVARSALEMAESGKINRVPNLQLLAEAKVELARMEKE